MDKVLKKVELIKIKGDDAETAAENIIRETPLAINVNGKHYSSVIIVAKLLKEFVVGHLFTQGIINKVSDIKSLIIKNNTADVTLLKRITKAPAPSKVKSSLKVSKEDVFKCVNAVLQSETFAETEGVHSAGLFLRGNKTLCTTEDIGRHNALDKIIGYGLLHNIDFSQTLAASTGRQPSEMVIKICRAGIPIIATKAAVTDRGVALAEKHGVTLIGFVRDAGTKMNTDMSTRVFKEAGMKIYCHAERVLY